MYSSYLLQDPPRVNVGLYAIFLENVFSIFPRKHIYINNLDVYAQDRIGVLERLYSFLGLGELNDSRIHDDVIKWKHFPRKWPFVRSLVNSPHKGQWSGALMFSLICVWISGWVNNREAGDLRRYRAHFDVILIPASRKFLCLRFCHSICSCTIKVVLNFIAGVHCY